MLDAPNLEPGPDLDAAVAAIFEPRPLEPPASHAATSPGELWLFDKTTTWRPIPLSTDLRAAAVLVSHLLRARIAVAVEPLEGTGEWGCDLFMLRWWRLADSAPLALCRSVLALRDEIKKTMPCRSCRFRPSTSR